jgi:GPH family glycoside/pentoside/hexuronide:cation symporter/probable glucitol transport protein GutA
MTVGDVPSRAMGAVITPDPTERTNAISLADTARSIGLVGAAVPVMLVALIFHQNLDTAITGAEFLVSAIIIAVLGSVLFFLIYKVNKERVPYQSEKLTFKEMIGVLKTNKPFLLLIISCFLGFGRQIQAAMNVQAANAILGGQHLILVIGLSVGVGAIVGMAVIPMLIKKFDELKVYIGVSVYGFVISMVAFFVGAFGTDGQYGMSNWYLIFPFLFLIGLQFGIVNLMPPIMTADCVDYSEYKTGKRNEGTIYAVLSLTVKVTLALSAALAILMIGLSGYDPDMNSATELVRSGFSSGSINVLVPADASGSTRNIIYFAFAALPGIFSLLAIIPMFRYKMYGKEKLRIAEELKARREAATVTA